MMIEREMLEELKEQWKEEVKAELLNEIEQSKHIKVLGREELQKLFNCDKFKMNKIMSGDNKPPVVYIGRDYYTTEQQMIEYFEKKEDTSANNTSTNNRGRKSNASKNKIMGYEIYSELKVLHKEDLMKMFKMGRTKFLQFIKEGTFPVKIIGQDCYITEKKLQEWFYKFTDTTVALPKYGMKKKTK